MEQKSEGRAAESALTLFGDEKKLSADFLLKKKVEKIPQVNYFSRM